MPSVPIPQYRQQTRAPRAGQLARHTPDSAQGLAAIGSAIGNVGEDLIRVKEQRASVWANDQLTQFRSKWMNEFKQRQEGASESGEGFTETTLKDFEEQANELAQQAPTQASREWLKQSLGSTGLGLQADAMQFEAARSAQFKVSGIERAIDASRTSVEFHPEQFDDIAAEQFGVIDAAGLSEDNRMALRRQATDALSVASVQGMIRKNPYAALKELNNEKTQVRSVALLPFDARLQLRNAAESELRQREINGRQQKNELAHALSERVRDAQASYRQGLDYPNPPSRADFVAAFGKDGSKAYESFAQEQVLGTDLQTFARLTDAEQDQLLAERAPRGGEGTAEITERFRVLASQAQQLRTQREKDPAAFVGRYSPSVRRAATQIDEPGGAQVYATATLAEQSRLGVQSPKILPADQASAIAQSFTTQNGESLVALIATEQEKWGKHWPQVYGELAAKKLPPAALAIGRGMAPGPATRLASVSALPFADLKKGVDVSEADVDRELVGKLSQFQLTLDGVVGAESTFSGMHDAVKRLSYSYVRGDMSATEATEQAYNEVLGDHYSFREVNNRAFRVPVEHDSDDVELGAQVALRDLPGLDALAPIPTGRGNEFAAIDDLKRTIAKRGYWVTSADGENGLALFLDGSPVLKSDGDVYELTWDQLRATQHAHNEAELNKMREKSAQGMQGVR